MSKTKTCWLWLRAKDAYGYGVIVVGGKKLKAHRFSWLLAHGSVPRGAHVLHNCDVRNCVNPAHLFIGDQAANMKDAARKNRLIGNRKLTEAQLAEIKRRYIPRNNGRALAREFNISLISVIRIAAGTQRKERAHV